MVVKGSRVIPTVSAGDVRPLCPECKLQGQAVHVGSLAEIRAIADGSVRCPSCGSSFPVIRGIAILVPEKYRNRLNQPGLEDREHAGFETMSTKKVSALVERFSGPLSLDVGCGKGPYSPFFNGDVVFADFNYRFVEAALARFQGAHEAFGVVADARLLPFPPGCFDYVLCSNIVEHLSTEEVRDTLLSMKEIAAGILQIDVPNENGLLAFLRRIAARIGLFPEMRYEDPALMHHAPLAPRDFLREGFEVHGCVHWVSRDKIRLGILWDLYDAAVWRLPSLGGTLIALCSKAGALEREKGEGSMEELWNGIGATYDNRWRGAASGELSDMELDFIGRFLELAPGGDALDIGVGTGRILDRLLRSDRTESVRGVDLSEAMAAHCRRTIKSKKFEGVALADISREEIPYDMSFDFITAVRVLSYCDDWKGAFSRTVGKLKPGGVMVFSMPNRNSINSFTPCPVPVARTTRAEVELLAAEQGVEFLAVETFTRLPDVLYGASKGDGAARALLSAERFLGKVIGGTALGRFLFVAVRKPGATSPGRPR
jgi:SAM-dependent methyltransferase